MLTRVTTEDISNFFTGNTYYFIGKFRGSSGIPSHILEQALLRAYKCPECLINKSCKSKVCSCVTPHMFFATDKEDGEGRWGRMLEPEEWMKFKMENNEWNEFLEKINGGKPLNYAKDFEEYFNAIADNYKRIL